MQYFNILYNLILPWTLFYSTCFVNLLMAVFVNVSNESE